MRDLKPGALGKVGVLYGGTSAERDVSLVTGQAILNALLEKEVCAEGFDVQPGFVPRLIEKKFDRVFLALHGPGGEDGSIQGLLKCLNIPFTGSDVMGSAIAMDKIQTKKIWQSVGIKTLPFVVVDAREMGGKGHQHAFSDPFINRLTHQLAPLGWPLCVKPATQGSTMGLSQVFSGAELPAALEQAARFDPLILIEPWITGEEYTVGILGHEALPSIRIRPKSGLYDYTSKYTKGLTEYDCPSGLSPEDEAHVQAISLKAFLALGCSGWGRVDLLRDQQGVFWWLEANTIPGMTPTSLVPKAAKVRGFSFSDLVYKILTFTVASGLTQVGIEDKFEKEWN